jgi:hypothetical protein
MNVDVSAVINRLVRYFSQHLSMSSAQRHYKLEEWAAVEAFGFFDREMPDWYAAGTLPYMSKSHKKEEKWTDVYAQFVEGGTARTHLWIEFKAIPFGAAKSSGTLRKFAQDVKCLSGMDKAKMIGMWKSHINPVTFKNHKSWFRKHDLPGLISEGDFIGVGLLRMHR